MTFMIHFFSKIFRKNESYYSKYENDIEAQNKLNDFMKSIERKA